jgi:hypothetical protein
MSDWNLYDKYQMSREIPISYRLSLVILVTFISFSTVVHFVAFIFADLLRQIELALIFISGWLVVIGLIKKNRVAHIVIIFVTLFLLLPFIMMPRQFLFNPLLGICVLIWAYTFILNPKVYKMFWTNENESVMPDVSSKSKVIKLNSQTDFDTN